MSWVSSETENSNTMKLLLSVFVYRLTRLMFRDKQHSRVRLCAVSAKMNL